MARTAQRRQQADATVTAVAVDNEEAPAHHACMDMPGAAHSIEYDVGSGGGGGEAAVQRGDSGDGCGFDVLSHRCDADGAGCGGDAAGGFVYLDTLERDRHALPLEPLTCLNAGVGAGEWVPRGGPECCVIVFACACVFCIHLECYISCWA